MIGDGSLPDQPIHYEPVDGAEARPDDGLGSSDGAAITTTTSPSSVPSRCAWRAAQRLHARAVHADCGVAGWPLDCPQKHQPQMRTGRLYFALMTRWRFCSICGALGGFLFGGIPRMVKAGSTATSRRLIDDVAQFCCFRLRFSWITHAPKS